MPVSITKELINTGSTVPLNEKPISYKNIDFGEMQSSANPLFQMLASLNHFSEGARRAYAECQRHIQQWNAGRLKLLRQKMKLAGFGWCTLCERMLPNSNCNRENYIIGKLALIRELGKYKSDQENTLKMCYELHTACRDCTTKWLGIHNEQHEQRTQKIYAYDMVKIQDGVIYCRNADDLAKKFSFDLFSVIEMEECHITRDMQQQFGIPPSLDLFENHLTEFEPRAGKPAVAYFQFQIGYDSFDLE